VTRAPAPSPPAGAPRRRPSRAGRLAPLAPPARWLLAILPLAILASSCEGRAPRDIDTKSSSTTSARSATPRAFGDTATSVVEIDLSKGLPEETTASLFGPPPRRSHLDLVRALRVLDAGPFPKGVFVSLGSASIGLARATEAGALLFGLRKRNIPVVCHADGYDNGSLLLAAQGCTQIWVSPAGGVDSIGIAAQLLYANRLLERLHIRADYLQVGKYKGAEEPFTRDGPSPEARASLEGALRGMRASWLKSIAEGRGKPEIEARVEDGPYAPEDAKREGLIDEIGYLDEARERAKSLASVDRIVARFGGGATPAASRGIVSILRALGGGDHSTSARLVVVPAIGGIGMAAGRALPLGGGAGISEAALGRDLTRLTDEANVKAVVIRIDSPGGSALASDLLWKKLMKLRDKKPLVFSVGGMAASGGYYLACTGRQIFAEPTSIIGSIGVVGGKLAVGGALEEIGVHAETIAAAPDSKRAARAAYPSPFAPWDEPTRKKVLASMTSVYDLFLRRVAEGRHIPVDAVAASAEGRVFGGVEAKERGLIDTIGGLDDALRAAIKLAGLPDDTPFETLSDDGSLLDLLGGEGAGSDEEAVGVASARSILEGTLTAPLREAVPDAAAFIGSFAPLARGERALAAVPFGLTIR
jgi:protease IV